MRRFIACFVVALMLLGSAVAEDFHFVSPAYAGLYGRELDIAYERSGGGEGLLLVLDEKGKVLGQSKVSENRKQGAVRIMLAEDMPVGQEIRLILQQNGQQLLQDTALLAVDYAKRDGVRRVNTQEKKIAITFDCAGGLDKIPQLMELLEKLDIHCTFFLQGEMVIKHGEWVTKLHQRGHEMANHSMLHPDMREISNSEIYREITRCNQLIEKYTGEKVTLYRPPSGYYTYRDRAIGRALGCEMILWTFDSLDGFYDTPRERIWNNMMKKSEPGAIILMHTYGRYTLDILQDYVPMMQEMGYEFVTITDLLIPEGEIDGDGLQYCAEDVKNP